LFNGIQRPISIITKKHSNNEPYNEVAVYNCLYIVGKMFCVVDI